MRILFFFILSCTLYAETWSVVYMSKSIKIKKSDIKNIYFKKIKQKNGRQIVPLNLYSSNPARIAFLSKVLNSDLNSWDKYYDEQYFSGIKSPLVLKSKEAMMKFLYEVDGSIGYIPTKKVDANLTELTRFEF